MLSEHVCIDLGVVRCRRRAVTSIAVATALVVLSLCRRRRLALPLRT